MTKTNNPSRALARRSTAISIKDTSSNQKALISRFGNEFSQALTVGQFIGLCRAYGLNPFMGHIVPFQGHPYIQHDGWIHLIQREAPGQLAKLDARPATKAEYATFGVQPTDYFAIATLVRRWPDGTEITFTRRALIPKRLTQPSQDETNAQARNKKARHIVEDPWDMVEKQARARVMRMAFNDCLQRAGDELPSLEEAQVDQETGEIIEAEIAPPPANDTVDWSRLWASAFDRGMDRPAVHRYFDVSPDEGALRTYALARAAADGKSVDQIVQDMADEIQLPHESGDAVGNDGDNVEQGPLPEPPDV